MYLWFVAISEMPVIGRHTKRGHGHLLSVWKAPEGPDTLEIVRRRSSDPGRTNGQMDVFVSMFGCSSSDARSG